MTEETQMNGCSVGKLNVIPVEFNTPTTPKVYVDSMPRSSPRYFFRNSKRKRPNDDDPSNRSTKIIKAMLAIIQQEEFSEDTLPYSLAHAFILSQLATLNHQKTMH